MTKRFSRNKHRIKYTVNLNDTNLIFLNIKTNINIYEEILKNMI